MNIAGLLLGLGLVFFLAYFTYGRYLSQRIFAINPNAKMPSVESEDGEDYVPSSKGIVFGHHFTSIAGTGPIVGPAVGVIWGWGPAVLWIVLGAIFMGAVHDMAAIVVSVRNKGKTVAEVAGKYISRRVRLIFFVIVYLSLLIVMAIFGLVIALIFNRFPEAVLPVWAEIPIAIALGWVLQKKVAHKGKAMLLAKVAFLGTFALGALYPITLEPVFGIPVTGVWTILLLVYAFVASTMKVNTLLQPRDYLNAWQLFMVMGLLGVAILVSGITGDVTMTAPVLNTDPVGAPSIWPFLFITIACGAVSGFHSLVGSGTTSKQVSNEAHIPLIGYGSMLVEAFLAILVIIAVTAGISLAYTTSSGEVLTGVAAWQSHYGSWMASSGLGSKLTALVIGASNILANIGIGPTLGTIIMGVFIASFAGTTLDSSTRIQRHIISELLVSIGLKRFSNKWVATVIAVVSAGALAFSSGANGKGALVLWPMFGAINQLLAALALMVATLYLREKGGWKYLVTGIPMAFMLLVSLWAAITNEIQFWADGAWLLWTINGVIVLLSVLTFWEACRVFVFGKTPSDCCDETDFDVEAPKGCC